MPVTIKDVTVRSGTSLDATIVAPATIADGDSCIVVFTRVSNQLSTSPTPGVTRIGGQIGGTSSQPLCEVYTKHNLLASDAGGTLMLIDWSSVSKEWKAFIIRTEALKDNDAAFTVFASNTAGGDTSLTGPNVTATAPGLGITILEAAHGNLRTPASGTERADADVNVTATNSCHVHIISYDIAAAGAATPPASTRDGGGNTAGSWPRVNVSFVADSTNALPIVSAIEREVIGVVDEPVTFGVTGSDADGTIASYAAAQITADSTITTPSLTNNGDGTFTFTPTAPIAYSFSCTATDDVGGVSAPAIVSVAVIESQPTSSTGTGVLRLGRRRRGSGLRGLAG